MRYDEEWLNEDESYIDYKVEDVRFPIHLEDMNGEVITYSIDMLNNK